jgi:hypothetical protein
MKKLNIEIKTKTNIIKRLEEQYELQFYKEQSFFEKILLKEKVYPDIYFHQGALNTKALDSIEHAKLSILNAKGLKKQALEKRSYLNDSKIEVLYPYIATQVKYSKKIKKDFRKLHEIPKETFVILFSAKDITIGGIDKFIDIVLHLENHNYLLVFDIDSKDKEKLDNKLAKAKLESKTLILKENYSKDELFILSDIYICPTSQTLFNPNVPKAMYLRNIVFVMRENLASEVIDSFSLILGVDDRSIYFKVDALLADKKELKKIQKENAQVVKNMTIDRYFEELQELIAFHIDK